jgi:hypothetical protein
MRNAWKSFVYVGAVVCVVLLANPSHAQMSQEPDARWTTPETPAQSSLSDDPMMTVMSDPDPDPDPNNCFTYTNDLRYCNVVKVKNGVCVHNRWGQYHNGQTGPDCLDCFDTVNNSLDFFVSHTETPLEEGCYEYNDCQFGTVYTCI